MGDFEEMLEQVHAKGMKLMMDLVVNHTSDEHDWFKEKPEYYIWRDEPNNWRSFFSGSAWEFEPSRGQYFLHLFSKKQPDLNWENPDMRKAVYGMMRWWLDKGVDGFRMDVINLISKDPDFPDGQDGDGGKYFMNGPKIHDYLQEMNREVLSDYDIVSVGEMPGAAVSDAIKYTGKERREVNMIFTFEHMGLDQASGEKWDLKPLVLTELKHNLEHWQHALFNKGWNSLYWNNHDQPRVVSRFGNDGEYRIESAKMLAACLHFMQGTPYIYQGEEIGMTNVRFDGIADYRDIETLNMYEEKRSQGIPHKKIMESIYAKGRDNARTPMQWSTEAHGGFTTGTPWISVNQNYVAINTLDKDDENSIYQFYKKLIRMRKTMPIITDGNFTLLHPADENVFAYERQNANEKLTVYCNFSSRKQTFEVPEGEVLINNYGSLQSSENLILRPYETAVFHKKF